MDEPGLHAFIKINSDVAALKGTFTVTDTFMKIIQNNSKYI